MSAEAINRIPWHTVYLYRARPKARVHVSAGTSEYTLCRKWVVRMRRVRAYALIQHLGIPQHELPSHEDKQKALAVERVVCGDCATEFARLAMNGDVLDDE